MADGHGDYPVGFLYSPPNDDHWSIYNPLYFDREEGGGREELEEKRVLAGCIIGTYNIMVSPYYAPSAAAAMYI